MYILYCHLHIHVSGCIILVLVSPRLIHQICICGTATSIYETEECVLQNILQVFSCHVRSPQLLSQDVEGDVADKHLPHHLWRCSSFSCAHRCAGEGVTGQADHNIFTPRVNIIFRSLFRYCKYMYYKYRYCKKCCHLRFTIYFFCNFYHKYFYHKYSNLYNLQDYGFIHSFNMFSDPTKMQHKK